MTTPAGSGSGDDQPSGGMVVVRRTGGITGHTAEGSVDTSGDDDRAREVRDLLGRIDLAARGAASSPQPDRYIYIVTVDGGEPVEVSESGLDDDTRRLVRLVLGGR